MLEKFQGRKIKGVMRDDEDLAILFEDGGVIYANPEGDCCSSTWVEHMTGVKDVIGHEVVAIDECEEAGSQGSVDESGYDCLALYGVRLVLDNKVLVDIDYRNESNGYYGGWLNWSTSSHVPDKLDEGWKMVTEDF